MEGKTKATVFNVQRFSLHDGPGIRTVVFLKGCSLHCLWCDNPESSKAACELGFSRASCNDCGKCVGACPEGALVLDGKLKLHRDKCTGCGECVSHCSQEALAVYGKERSAEEVFREVERDARFFRRSGGGVTLSGGEPLRHPAFASELLKICREAGIHTAIETCGFAGTAALRQVLPFIDHVFFDLKHLDPEKHRQLTGESNSLILENAAMAVKSGANVHFRMPLIPGLNSSPENIKATAGFLRTLCGDSASLELMPYHRLGMGKYEAVGMEYQLKDLVSASPEFVKSVQQAFEEAGIPCTWSK